MARIHPALQRGRSPIRDQERQDRPRRRAQGRGVEEVEGLTAALPCRSGGSRELFAPSPAKAGEGWGGVLSGSRRTVATPSQPPPAVAGGGAKAKARGFRRSYQSPIRSEEHTSALQTLMRISYAVFCLKKKHRHGTNIRLRRSGNDQHKR